MPNLLHHIDLTTGYHAVHRIDTLSQCLVNKYGRLLLDGGIVPFLTGQFEIRIDGPRFTMFHEDFPFHEGGIGIGKDATWTALDAIIKDLDWSLEAEPRPGLWLGEVPLPYIYELRREQVYWIFDFLRLDVVGITEFPELDPGVADFQFGKASCFGCHRDEHPWGVFVDEADGGRFWSFAWGCGFHPKFYPAKNRPIG
jgi:hypothetical protein